MITRAGPAVVSSGAAVAMLFMLGPSAQAQARPPHTAPTPEVAAPAGSPASRLTLGAGTADLPDSVLALVGDDRTITRSAFTIAWRQGSAPPDSLTPEAARRFLGLLVDRELLGAAAVRETWTWTPQESTQYLALRDRLTLGAALDSALRRTQAASGNSGEDPQALGMAVRDSTVAGLQVRFDEALLERLARAWAELPRPQPGDPVARQLRTLSAQPRIDPTDAARAVAHSSRGDLSAAALLDSWRRLSPAYRLRIESADQVRDLASNLLFERELRRAAEARGLERRPDIAATLARAREGIAVAHYMEREVYAGIRRDSPALDRYYRAHRDEWALPLRVRVIRMVLSEKPEAERMTARLMDAAAAESLAAMAARRGLDYEAAWSARSDSVWFAAAMRAGVGAVIGPAPYRGDWLVARVVAVQPGRERRLDEVRGEVEDRLVAEQAERRTRALCDRLRKRTSVVVNRAALAALRLEDRPARP